MSSTSVQSGEQQRRRVRERYTEGRDRYINFAEDILDLRLTAIQKRVLRALAEHQRVHVQAGNGVGKSFTAAIANLAFLFTNYNSTNMATSGTYSVLSDVLWKPMKGMYKNAKFPLQEEARDLENPPRLIIDDEWFFKAVSPTHPDNLEGRHANAMLVTIEEVDKPDITVEHFDSAGSMITDANDRFLAICNPPRDENNVAYRLKQSDRWHTIEFSSFDSHNVLVDAGKIDAEKIPGLVDLETIKEDWEAWNGEPWPGFAQAKLSHLRDDLDERWYRRRLGKIPPSGSETHRPITTSMVEGAWQRSVSARAVTETETPQTVGIDVARTGGDTTALAAVHGDVLSIPDYWHGSNHVENEERINGYLSSFASRPVAIDATGEGSALADNLQTSFPDVRRFHAGSTAADETEYRNCWTEGLALLGQFLRDGGVIRDRRLREELFAAARVVEFTERHLASRGATILEASSKEDIKDRLGRSPDLLDAALMAIWQREAGQKRTVSSTWAT